MNKFKLSQLLLVTCWLGLQAFTGLKVNRLNVEGSNQFSNLQPTNLQPATLTQPATLLTKSFKCPNDIETLTSLLLRDLPSYANRVMQRTRRLNRSRDSFFYVVVAGRPELEPLSLGPGQYTPVTPPTEVEPPKQLFFTTLERQYQRGRAINTQLFHWLFLTQTSDGWRMVMMFSRIGSSTKERPPTPPLESSNGIVGQAVNTWLRDCRAGTIRTQRTIPRPREADK